MSRRPMVSPDDSLELLLDTICNTFATVIFISMLASILAQNSAPAAASATETQSAIDETHARQRELSELNRRQNALQSQLAQQSDLIERFSSDESVALAMQIHQDSESQAKMSSQKVETADAIITSERDRLQLEQAVQEQLKLLQDEQMRQTEGENNLRNLQTSAGHTAEVRRVHETTKFGFTFALDNGRLYSVHTSDDKSPTMMNLMIDRDDCEVTEAAGITAIRPLKNAGTPIRNSPTAQRDAKGKLSMVNKNFVVRLFVAKDSFAEFLPVKEALTELGLEYSLEIMPGEDVELLLTDKTQDRTFVQ
ncbi:MAG: hypothetical protein NTX48_08175 [Planctomycetales bacterium]|nr:hypothetical protein [Planctomycetales bacterium]